MEIDVTLRTTFSPSFQALQMQALYEAGRLTSAVSPEGTPLRLLVFWNVMTTVAAALDPFRCTVRSLTSWADPPLDRIDLEVCNAQQLLFVDITLCCILSYFW